MKIRARGFMGRLIEVAVAATMAFSLFGCGEKDSGKPVRGVASKTAKVFQTRGGNEGLVKEYYKSGKLKLEGVFKNGRPEGPYKEYFENGQVRADSFFKNGIPEGLFRTYYENGQLRTERFYKNGAEVKKAKQYNPDGTLRL